MFISLVTFPILTRVLEVEQYAILALVTTTVAMAVVVGKAGLSDGIIRFYELYMKSESLKAAFFSTISTFNILLSLTVALCYVALLPYLYTLLHVSKQFQICFFLMAICVFLRPLSIVPLTLMRTRGETKFLVVISFINRISSAALGLSFLLIFFNEFYDYFIGIIIANFLFFIFLYYWFFSNFRVKISSVSLSLTKQLVTFGVPLLFTELAYMLLTYADRYMILYYHGEKELGLYSVGYNLAMYIAQITTFSISYAIVPLYVKVFNTRGRKETETFLKDCLYYLLVAIIPMCFGYAALSRDLFAMVASVKYISAASFSPIILVATFIFGMNNILNAGLYLQRKSNVIFAIVFSGVVSNVLLNLLLLPKYHVIGASWATLISCLETTILTLVLSFRYIHIGVNRRILYHVVLSSIMYLSIVQVHPNGLVLSLSLKVLLGFLITISGVLLLEKEITARVKSYICMKLNAYRY